MIFLNTPGFCIQYSSHLPPNPSQNLLLPVMHTKTCDLTTLDIIHRANNLNLTLFDKTPDLAASGKNIFNGFPDICFYCLIKDLFGRAVFKVYFCALNCRLYIVNKRKNISTDLITLYDCSNSAALCMTEYHD